MGTPNNQNVHELAMQIVTDPAHRVSEEDLHKHGFDINVLEATFTESIKPYLKYLVYEKLGNSGEFGDMLSSSLVSGQLARFSDAQARKVLDVELRVPGTALYQSPSRCIKVWMTRLGTWVVWTANKQCGAEAPRDWRAYAAEQAHHFESVGELARFLESVTPAEFHVAGRTDRHLPRFLPLMIERALRDFLSATIEERRKRLSALEGALQSAERRVSVVTFPVY